MIKFYTPSLYDDLIAGMRQDPVISTTMYSTLHRKGSGADFWVQSCDGKPCGAIMGLDGGNFHVAAGDESDRDELEQFLRAMPSIGTILVSPELGNRFSDLGTLHASSCMQYRGSGFEDDGESLITNDIPLRLAYNLLDEVHSWFAGATPWDSWYTDLSYMIRHNKGMVCGIMEGDGLISTGMISAVGEECALISGIATHPAHRGKGYAAAITKVLVNQSLAWGKTPCLYCAEDDLADYYQKLGFVVTGRWVEMQAYRDLQHHHTTAQQYDKTFQGEHQ